jgi:hypothetical protein
LGAPQIADDPVAGGLWPDAGPVRKLAAEMTALALTDAGLREVAGTRRTGLIIAGSVPELGGGDRGALAGQLDVIAASAALLSDDGLDGLARAGNVREHAGQPDGTADARRGGSRPFRADPRRGGQLRRSGKPGPFG